MSHFTKLFDGDFEKQFGVTAPGQAHLVFRS